MKKWTIAILLCGSALPLWFPSPPQGGGRGCRGEGVYEALAAAPPTKPSELPEAIQGAQGLDEVLRTLKAKLVTTPVLSPQQALAGLRIREGLAVDLIAHEPTIKQPLYLSFDERGRIWVVQYRQYPFPAGLKVVAYDKYIRAKFDKVPPPPPDHFKGVDRITIHEDVRGDGSYSKVTTFLDGLNIATAALVGRGGVWVLNPPYLLFYPDPERTDKAAPRPVVHLSGFGLEDTHAVASSLCWGPDGWLYGAHGSTVTAKVKVEVSGDPTTTDFLGQAIWRYHPEKHLFEIFAEGGGNTFGVAFDDVGRVYSGTNWGKYRGLHFVQGGYYLKSWGKHGPLTNPYALGYFDHMPHVGDADRLTHTFISYGETALPELRGKFVGVNALQHRVQVTKLLPHYSTFRTEEEPFLLTTDDQRFRPVDVKAGPDGALYVADLYEPRINHVDPRDNWDRATGRLYRIRPKTYQPVAPFDLAKKSSEQLIGLLRSENRWYRDMAKRLLADRKEDRLAPLLREIFERETGQTALEILWTYHLSHGLDEEFALVGLRHDNPHVRRWTVRLLGDERTVSAQLGRRLAELAAHEPDAEVRSQLASSAKRFPASLALDILCGLWRHDQDRHDPHIPLLTWWALEAKAETHRQLILDRIPVLSSRMFQEFILERLAQRWAMSGTRDDLLACAHLLDKAPPGTDATHTVIDGLEKGFAGRSTGRLPEPLRQAILKELAFWPNDETAIKLGLRVGHEPAVKKALELVANDKAELAKRLACLRILGEIDVSAAVPTLLHLVQSAKDPTVRLEALTALTRYPDEKIGQVILALEPARWDDGHGLRLAAWNLLASRPVWARQLLTAIEAGKINPRGLPLEIVHKLALHKDTELTRLIAKHWGNVRATPREKQKEMLRIGKILKVGTGDARAGRKLFADTCGKCHKLYGSGGDVGPELTGYERSNALYWIENIVDPSAVIREEYMTFVVETSDGRTLTGVIAGQDKTTVTLKDPQGRITKLDRRYIDDLRALPQSLMPEDQLRGLKDQEVRDLFAYLMSKTPPK